MDKRFILWAVLSTCLLVGLFLVRSKWFPPDPPKEEPRQLDKAKAAEHALLVGGWMAGGVPGMFHLPSDANVPRTFQTKHEEIAKAQKEAEAREAEKRLAAAEPEGPPIVLGEGEGYKLRVELSKRGGAVRRTTLKDYRAADRDYAGPRDGPLVLISDDDDGQLAKLKVKEQLERQSFRFQVDGAEIAWTVKEQTPSKVVFVGELPAHGVTVTRTFELQPGSYHVDMTLSLAFGEKAKKEFVYKLTGPRGMPIEGIAWQQRPYRQIVVGTVDAKDGSSPKRTLIPAKPIREGKAEKVRLSGDREEMQFAGVVVQYFAALVVVAEDPTKARYIDNVVPENYGDDPEFPSTGKELQGRIGPTLVSRPMPGLQGVVVEHKYLLYTGPVKVRLLNYEAGVAAGLPDRYEDEWHLNLLTDAPTYKVFGYLGWTGLIVIFTNVMHWLLGKLFFVSHNFGIAIILLTLIVRTIMFPVSRRMALSSQKMQQRVAAMKPELEKLKERFKDNQQEFRMAQMELYKKHGMLKPQTGCLLIFLQMPVMMGLYYALYESIDLRFAGFLWIDNLAVPDALLNWKDVPLLGGLMELLRFGPTLNVLPIISCLLMYFQQKFMMPPAADEQQAAQMKMMNFMMIFMAWMFYWVPAGLCIYFIISGAWGILERKLLPKISHDKSKTEAGAAPAAAVRSRGKPSSNGNRNGVPGVFGRIAEWWQEILKRAEKK